MAGFGWVDVVAVAGDAAKLYLLEGGIEVVEGEDDEVFGEGPTVGEGGHDGAIDDVPGEVGVVFFGGDDFEEVGTVFGGGVTAEFTHDVGDGNLVALAGFLHGGEEQFDEGGVVEVEVEGHGYGHAPPEVEDM